MTKIEIKQLLEIAEEEKQNNIIDLFGTEPNRIDNFSIDSKEIYLDYSKNQLTFNTYNKLISLCDDSYFKNSIRKMYDGEKINHTENRKVLHYLLRSHEKQLSAHVETEKRLIKKQLAQMSDLVSEIRSRNALNRDRKLFSNILVIGIGGSHLGPELVSEALLDYHVEPFNMKFLVNADPTEFRTTIEKLNAKKTLVIVISKSMATDETILNLKAIKEWFMSQGIKNIDIGNHVITVSNNKTLDSVGIKPFKMLSFGDWVGGRYSLWSSVGLPIALQIGFDNFIKLLDGAANIDQIFLNNDIKNNIPKILALIAFWNSRCLGKSSYAVMPYDARLKLLPQYLQQLEMESNGKSINSDGQDILGNSAPLTWGGIGTSSQHAVFQFLHQSTHKIPVDFIVAMDSSTAYPDLQRNQIANCIAQSEALMIGNKKRVNKMKEPHKFLSGNVPSNTIIIKKLDPFSLGSLLAIYEHKTFFLSLLFSINAFDQWGVEDGKLLAKRITSDIKNKKISPHDPSTEKLISMFIKSNGQ
ncbi:MAG: glucose-6-phosphate isomerase [Methylococcaceae bacterium TMED69]|nr:MAG: glucose-6-phosphate isomerase [Methylococcaceae bacterium TMED69]